jgi:hypothetical protein
MDVYEVQDSSRKEEGLTRSRDETSNGSPSYDTVGGEGSHAGADLEGGGGRTLLPLKMALCRSLGTPCINCLFPSPLLRWWLGMSTAMKALLLCRGSRGRRGKPWLPTGCRRPTGRRGPLPSCSKIDFVVRRTGSRQQPSLLTHERTAVAATGH